MFLRDATVISTRDFSYSQELQVEIVRTPDNSEFLPLGTVIKALSYPQQVGWVKAGNQVRVECSPLIAKLGTGGNGLVTAVLDSLPNDSRPENHGHIMKARYTPSQCMVSSVEEQDSPYHLQLKDKTDLSGLPLVVLDLHSQLPAVLSGIRASHAGLKVAYIHTQGAALPAHFSRSVWQLRENGYLDAVITSGQSYGGDYEAINDASALLVAKEIVQADICVIGQGPGNAGTGTALGFSGFENAAIINLAAQMGAKVIASLRISAADQRKRHYGISHHSATVLRYATRPALIAVPDFTSLEKLDYLLPLQEVEFTQLLSEQLEALSQIDLNRDLEAAKSLTHHLCPIQLQGITSALKQCPVRLSTMGRGLESDPAIFIAAAAAGRLATHHLVP